MIQNQLYYSKIEMCETMSITPLFETTYFDMNINTDKLSKEFFKIHCGLNEHEEKMNKMNIDFMRMYQALQSKLSLQIEKTNMLFTKMNKQMTENSNLMKMYVSDLDKNIKNNQQSCNNLDAEIKLVKSLINRIGDTMKEDLNCGLNNLKEEIIGPKQLSQFELVQVISSDTNDLQSPKDNISIKERSKSKEVKKSTLTPVPQDLSTIFHYLSAKISELTTSLPEKIQDIMSIERQKLKKQEKEQFFKKGLQKQKAMREFSDKDKEPQQSHRFVYPSSSIKNAIIQEGTKKSESIIKKTDQTKENKRISIKENDHDFEVVQIQRQIQQRINAIQISKNRFIDEMNNKLIINEEKYLILNRKIEKVIHQLGEIKLSTRRLQVSKNDQKLIEQLRNYVKWAIRELQQKIALKCDHLELDGEKKKIFEKISIIHENLLEKAQKGQIQKALIFLQGKIKEIILLIASEQNQQRDGAMVKTAIKCLSCDKDLQKNISHNDKKDMKQGSGNYSRSLTHRTRQKYKQSLKQTLTSGNQSLQYL